MHTAEQQQNENVNSRELPLWGRLFRKWPAWQRSLWQREDQVLLVLSLVIGALTGLAVVAFILLTERLGARLFPVNSPAWRRILFPIAGSLSMGYVLYRYFPGARGSGVQQTKAALFAGGVIDFRSLFGKFFCTSATLASGIPLGPEGPAIYVGSGIASVLARRLGVRAETLQALIPVGAAAALAAAFNTPIAAVLFVLEEIVGDFNVPVLGSIVLASAASWMVLRLLLGNNPLFVVPQYQLVHPAELAIYGVLGVAGGLVGAAFIKLLVGMRAHFLRLPRFTTWFRPVAGGLLVALIGWQVPQVLGVGYSYVHLALNEQMGLRLMALLVLLKLIGTATSYASGNAGGIFAPALYIGAMLGGAVGGVAHMLFPHHTASAGAYALVGMGAAFAGIVRAPMTSVLLIFEITRNYAVIVPLMIANIVSLLISARLQPQPIYEALAEQDGIHLPSAEVRRKSDERRVVQVMHAAKEIFPAQMTVQEALEQAKSSAVHAWPVVGEEGLVGMIGLARLEQSAANGEQAKPLSEIIDKGEFPHLHADHPLHVAIERMGAAKLDVLPVVSRTNIHELFGVVNLPDVFSSYGLSRI